MNKRGLEKLHKALWDKVYEGLNNGVNAWNLKLNKDEAAILKTY